MSDFTESIDESGLNQVRTNPSYSAGILVNAGDVVAEFAQSPWLRATTSINLYEESAWAERVKAVTTGLAVVYRSPEGTDYRTVLGPKISWGALSGNSGKSAGTEANIDANQLIEVELNFAAGRTTMPTVVAGRTTQLPKGGTLTANAPVNPPPMVGNIGQDVPQTDAIKKTAQGTNNATGTCAIPNAVLQFLGIPTNNILNKQNGGVAPMDPFENTNINKVNGVLDAINKP